MVNFDKEMSSIQSLKRKEIIWREWKYIVLNKSFGWVYLLLWFDKRRIYLSCSEFQDKSCGNGDGASNLVLVETIAMAVDW